MKCDGRHVTAAVGRGRPSSPDPKGIHAWHKLESNSFEKAMGKGCQAFVFRNEWGQVNYMTLPGKDLLDIEAIANTCKQNNKALNFLGFNRGEDDNELLAQTSTSTQMKGTSIYQ